jgi:micrococcal nuclease
MNQRTVRLIITAALVAVALISQRFAARTDAPGSSPVATPEPRPDGMVLVTAVIDGDTIEIEGGARVRYIGIDTPETVHPTKAVQCFGKEASAYNATLVEGAFVRLESDITDVDRYGRLLRYVYLADGTFVNLKLVADGYAYAYTYPPDVAHAQQFKAAQSEAQSSRRGLWASCPVNR